MAATSSCTLQKTPRRRRFWKLCCSRLNGNQWDADEVAQNTFLKAYERIADYRGGTGAELVAWLRTAAKRCCVDRIRESTRLTEKVKLAMAHLLRSPFDWAQDMMREDNRWRCIWRALEQLDADKREVFFLRHEGATTKNIAKIDRRSSSRNHKYVAV